MTMHFKMFIFYKLALLTPPHTMKKYGYKLIIGFILKKMQIGSADEGRGGLIQRVIV